MNAPQSPLFPPSQLTSSVTTNLCQDEISSLLPQLPDKPITQTSSIQVFIITPEKNLFIEGFEANEYSDRPPTLLRGCLFLRVLKPSKIKSITLSFKGQQRTDWPEGIPPKKTTYSEVNDVVSHTWPFYQPNSTAPNGGADLYQEPSKNQQNQDLDVTHLSLAESTSRALSPLPTEGRGFLARSMSPAASLVKRATSPSVHDVSNDLSSVPTAPDSDASKPGHFPAGDYLYNFEHPLHPSVPESTSVNFGSVNYYLDFSIVRTGAFKPNLTGRLPIEIVRIPSESSLEENEPIVISRDWEDQLRYEIVISGKSIVLDSYLPLAFRFIPLFGKVSLHRIRVYLSEDLEYYCQNKKVHRMEPTKKFLLLEHKAEQGKSLLATHADADEQDYEVLPKELEFQLYVPRLLNGKHSYVLHPDTSFANIQSHHWIKICLRVSKKDPENSEKKKHYEISIDSPIHVLSPLASHNNTLLPAYDDYNSSIPNIAERFVSTPPLSPDVIPVNFGDRMPNIDDIEHIDSNSSLDNMLQGSNTRRESHRSSLNNEIPPPSNMHLEANLYKPEPEKSMNSALNSPQAVPHPATFSPSLSSPIQRPIHLLRRPSINPPPFEASEDQMLSPPVLPPAYEEEDPRSMSPLRINNSSSRERSRKSSLVPPDSAVTAALNPSLSIKESLSQQMNCDGISTGHSKASVEEGRYLSKPVDIDSRISNDDGEDIVDFSSSPIRAPDESGLGISSHMSLGRGINSRKSSVSSAGYNSDSPIEQTMPLLTTSTTSLPNGNEERQSRNASVNSLMPENFKNYRQIDELRTEIADIVDDNPYGGQVIGGNLSQLRNPRIKKHYQDSGSATASKPSGANKERQKSFGVVDNNIERLSKFNLLSGHEGSKVAVEDNELNAETKDEATDPLASRNGLPRFEYSYTVE